MTTQLAPPWTSRYRGLMARRTAPSRATHVVLWSSPVLALVLILSTWAPTHPSRRATSSPASAATTAPIGRTGGVPVLPATVVGSLTRTTPRVELPLRGPGTWTITASAVVTTRLRCSGPATAVPGRLALPAGTSCLVDLTNPTSHTAPWRLHRTS